MLCVVCCLLFDVFFVLVVRHIFVVSLCGVACELVISSLSFHVRCGWFAVVVLVRCAYEAAIVWHFSSLHVGPTVTQLMQQLMRNPHLHIDRGDALRTP